MKIDTEHLHHWMQAIRKSQDPMRTMDAFWSGQFKSKEWLIDQLTNIVVNPVSIDIHGGWIGSLASLLFQSDLLKVTTIRSIDIDPLCESIATELNAIEFNQGKFTAITSDMCNISSTSDVVINTSCEHITQEQYDIWLSKVSINSVIVLQSNNYNIPEHIRCASSIDDFARQCNIKVIYEGELELPLYTRYMVIGHKLV
jgi:hypothetical protein